MPKPPSAHALRAHELACQRNEQGYIDPDTGFFVMTSLYLKQQGSCCGNGCRHCPWDKTAQDNAGRDPKAPCWPYPPTK